jgi:phosphoribosyl-ATP pyrophosphohydrolase
VIGERQHASAGSSYTRQLLDAGTKRCARKFGEEAMELVIASLAEDDTAVAAESADVIYHLLVLLAARGIPLQAVTAELERRLGTSGLDEKAARAPTR